MTSYEMLSLLMWYYAGIFAVLMTVKDRNPKRLEALAAVLWPITIPVLAVLLLITGGDE